MLPLVGVEQLMRVAMERAVKAMCVFQSVLGGRWWMDIFWFLFVPFSVFRIRYVGVRMTISSAAPQS